MGRGLCGSHADGVEDEREVMTISGASLSLTSAATRRPTFYHLLLPPQVQSPHPIGNLRLKIALARPARAHLT